MTMISEILAQPADRIAVAAGNREVSYGELAGDVHRACAFLLAQNLAGRTIGIHLGPQQSEHDYATWVAHLAALRIGATHVSIPSAPMLDKLLQVAKLDVLVGRMPEGASASIASIVPFDLAALPEANASKDNEAEAVRLSLTSGTTGEPKLVRWDAAEMEQRVAQAGEVGGIGPDSQVGSMLGLRTTAGFRYPIATWRAGGCVLLSNRLRASDGRPSGDPFHPAGLLTFPASEHHERRQAVARQGAAHDRRPRRPGAGRAYGNGHSPISPAKSSSATDRPKPAISRTVMRRSLTGTPAPSATSATASKCEIVGEDGKPVPAGQPGRVQVRPASAPGDRRRKPGWAEPGDLGVLYEDGLLAIEGRDADVLNAAGVKVAAGDIKSKLASFDGITDAGVTVFNSGDRDILAVAIVADDGRQLQDLVGEVSALIPRGAEYRMFFVPRIPRNEMGKIDRPRLVETVDALLRPAAARNRVDA